MDWSQSLDIVTRVAVIVFGVYTLLKFAFFFALAYDARRRALDRAYDGKASATSVSDNVLLALVVILSALLLFRGADPTGFLGGLLIGATLVQLYFHRFDTKLPKDREPPFPASPIKIMSYAIQDAPARPWKEMLVITILIGWSFVQFWKGGGGL